MNTSPSLVKSNKNFLLFWSGQTVSMFGSQVTIVGLPLTAVYLLKANSFEMGLFQACATIPFFLFSLIAGAWIDQSNKRSILLVTNLLTGLCLLVIPIFAFLNALNFYVFYIVVFLSATFSMMFELAYLSFVPIIVSREDLYRANRNLEVSRSLSQIFGQSIAGFLINILSAPISIMIDSISYFISLFFMWKIKMNEKRETVTENINIFKRILKGLKVLINSRILLSISISTAILNFCRTAFETIYILYIVRNVGMHASQIGLIYGLGSIGGIIGAYFSEFISKKMGIGISIIGATVLIGVGGIVVFTPYFHSKTIALILLTLGQMLSGFGNMLYFVSQVSLRQAITPLKILGSVNASNRFITRGAMPLGGVIGGVLGSYLGLKMSLFIFAAGFFSFNRNIMYHLNLQDKES